MSFLRAGLTTSCAALFVVCFARWHSTAQQLQPQHSSPEVVYVGLLEDDRRELDRLGPNDPTPVATRIITPAFEKDGNEWRQVVNLNRHITWTLAFDGKKLGELESQPIPNMASQKVTGPTDIQSILTPLDKIPSIGKPQARFNGNFGRLVRRPLVVISKPYFADPDHWVPRELPQQEMSDVRSTFRKTFRHLRQCDSSGEALKDDWKFPDSEIVMRKSYESNKHDFIVETKVLHNKCLFDAERDDFQSLGGNQVFYVASDHKVIFLGLQWELVDAGDYDADGNSEVIFYIAEGKDIDVETEGYVLFYDDFRHNVRFVWKDQ